MSINRITGEIDRPMSGKDWIILVLLGVIFIMGIVTS